MQPARLHCPVPMLQGQDVALPAEAARHAQVLRLQPGSAVELFHGGLPQDVDPHPAAPLPLWASGWYSATITRMQRNAVHVRVGEHHAPQPSATAPVHLAVGVPANARMDWLIEKAAELGAASIQPLLTQRSTWRADHPERAQKRRAHWQATAVAACAQSRRSAVPVVHAPMRLDAWLQQHAQICASQQQPLACWLLSLHAQSQTLAQAMAQARAASACWLLCGPEGGLNDAEEHCALRHGWQRVSLGAHPLRAETAPLAALACWTLCV